MLACRLHFYHKKNTFSTYATSSTPYGLHLIQAAVTESVSSHNNVLPLPPLPWQDGSRYSPEVSDTCRSFSRLTAFEAPRGHCRGCMCGNRSVQACSQPHHHHARSATAPDETDNNGDAWQPPPPDTRPSSQNEPHNERETALHGSLSYVLNKSAKEQHARKLRQRWRDEMTASRVARHSCASG